MPDNVPVFVDSNVWLYAFLPSQNQAFAQVANRLIREKRPNIILSTQVVNEITNNLLRKGGFSEEDIRTTIRMLYQNFQVIPLNLTIHETASNLRERYQFSHFDGIIAASALSVGATTLYSEDMHNGLIIENQTTIVNPFAIE